MNKKVYFGTNTKMYKTIANTVDFVKNLANYTADLSREEYTFFVIPSFTALSEARKTVDDRRLLLGAQNMHWEDEGQFTGEISPLMLKEIGINIIEIGHSERRHVIGETDEEENKKALSALRHDFIALLCIGETANQKALKLSDEVLSTQLKIGLAGVKPEELDRVWIAYEPVWSIGVSGIPASPEYADEKMGVIKSVLQQMFGNDGKEKVPVLYGGSVNLDNCEALAAQPNIDGLFVGRAAWKAESFNLLIRKAIPCFKTKE
jgi:triosephosphate isomerase